MARHIGAYSALHGPAGGSLTEYIETNIPDLWDRVIDPISAVTNTATQFVGTVEDLVLPIPPDKGFWFTPHVVSGLAPVLSLNASAFYPLVDPAGIAISTGLLVPTGRYLLNFTPEGKFLVVAGIDTISIEVPVPVFPEDTTLAALASAANAVNTAGKSRNILKVAENEVTYRAIGALAVSPWYPIGDSLGLDRITPA